MAPEVFANWLAAASVVALGAPFCAIAVNLISRTPTLVVVTLLCIAQFFWTIVHEQVTGWSIAEALLGVMAVNGIFHTLYRWGQGRHVLDYGLIEPSEQLKEEWSHNKLRHVLVQKLKLNWACLRFLQLRDFWKINLGLGDVIYVVGEEILYHLAEYFQYNCIA